MEAMDFGGLSNAQADSLIGESVSPICMMAVLGAVVMNPVAPWWHDTDDAERVDTVTDGAISVYLGSEQSESLEVPGTVPVCSVQLCTLYPPCVTACCAFRTAVTVTSPSRASRRAFQEASSEAPH